jgi:hypothetical protein
MKLPLLTFATAAAVAALPPPVRAEEEAEVVAEALFLHDALPPGGRDLSLSLAFERSEPDEITGRTEVTTSPRLQLGLALGERVGVTADVGISSGGSRLETPGAALKLLLREPDASATGLAASLDFLGSTESFRESEAGVGLGAIRGFGRLALRAAISAVSSISTWSPHLHGGFSAAVALGARWRVLGEVMAEASSGEVTFLAGPTLKVALDESTALMAGALFDLGASSEMPVIGIQLSRSM